VRRRPRTLAGLGERDLLKSLRQYLARAGGELIIPAPDDDAAVWRTGSIRVVATVDTMVEDIDFRRRWPGFDFRQLGRRLMTINLSDLAAMGATPRYALVSLALPRTLSTSAVDNLYAGIAQQAQRFHCAIAGGDLSATRGGLTLTVAVFGELPRGRRPLTRRGARAGWRIGVTGWLGSAAAGLALLEAGRRGATAAERRWVRAQLEPVPRLEAARVLQRAGVRVAGDISDGLYREVEKIAEPAGLGAELWADRLPIEPSLQRARGVAASRLALFDSEDYELICAAPQRTLETAAAALVASTGLRLTEVGQLTREPGVTLFRNGRRLRLRHGGFDHFR
jgi:thiamine-monophosphate kinase